MSEEVEGNYGFSDDEEQIGSAPSFSFGLNAGAAKLKKFEWIPNGGSGGAEGEALDIIFDINGQDKGYRMFPVTKAFLANNAGETTDPKSEEMKAEFTRFNSIITHIMTAFVGKDVLTTALSTPIPAGPDKFKNYCKILQGLLPSNAFQIPLDIFTEYQWQITKDNKITFLQIPKKMKGGKWLCKAIPAKNADGSVGVWREIRKTDPATNDPQALYYTDEAGNVHPFMRNGWWVNSNYATQQKEEHASAGGNINQGSATEGAPAAPVQGWT